MVVYIDHDPAKENPNETNNLGSCGGISVVVGAAMCRRLEVRRIRRPWMRTDGSSACDVASESALLSEQTRAESSRLAPAAQASRAGEILSFNQRRRRGAPRLRFVAAKGRILPAPHPSDGCMSCTGRMTPQTIGVSYTEVFTPTDGIAPKNKNRILLNVHAAGSSTGRASQPYGVRPIASLGQIKVISIDYRQAPEFEFPAANED